MPEQKGRKKKQRERDRRPRDDGAPAPDAPPAAPRPSSQPTAAAPMPSMTARATGFLVAAFTAFLAVLMIYNAVTSDDASAPDAAIRIFIGTLLVLLAIFVGALVLAPAQIRDFVSRRRRR